MSSSELDWDRPFEMVCIITRIMTPDSGRTVIRIVPGVIAVKAGQIEMGRSEVPTELYVCGWI